MTNHPASGLSFDYEHTCNTCQHFADKTRTNRGAKFRAITCALDPDQRNLATAVEVVQGVDQLTSTVWKAMPACSKHKPKTQTTPRQ